MDIIIFWLSLIFIFFVYLGYPILIWIQKEVFPKPVMKEKPLEWPSVSVILICFNEYENIVQRIENLLSLDYPDDKLEIVVTSDGSTDGTEQLVKKKIDEKWSIVRPSVKFKVIHYFRNRGKAFALNKSVEEATGQVLIFADARQSFEAGVVKELVANFTDPNVGCVSGELVFYQDSESEIRAEMGAYWKYEKWIRKNESISGSVIGATGAIYAVRRELFCFLPEGTLLDDVMIPMKVILQGYRTVFDSSAVAYDIVSKDSRQEWRRKVRTLAGNWQILSLCPEFILPWRNPLWWRFLFHKTFRVLVPLPLLASFVTSLSLDNPFFVVAAFLQLGLYFFALLGSVISFMRRYLLIRLCYFFVMLNLAAAVGFFYWISGQCTKAWHPGCNEK